MTRLLKRVLVGATLGSTLLFSACGLFKDQSSAANDFFTLISTDVEAAYESTAPEFKAISSLEDLQAFVEMYPETLDVVDLSFNSFDQSNDYTELTGTVTYGAGWSESIGVYLYKSDVWRVGGFEMGI